MIELFYLLGEGFLIFFSGDLVGDDSKGIDWREVFLSQFLFYFLVIAISDRVLFLLLLYESPLLFLSFISGSPFKGGLMFQAVEGYLSSWLRSSTNGFLLSRYDPFL